jgi:bifunctional UDP-N-acetylglucosamine pyrophosphorylase/glucosamine-1-phosphate N-acetyltransferase
MNSISLLTFKTDSPAAYGRILRTERGEISAIVENKNATSAQKMINEVNSGVYAFDYNALPLLNSLRINKLKKEYYLTDIVSIARKRGLRVGAYSIGSEEEFIGVNTPVELERARQLMRERIMKYWSKRGVSFLDSSSVFISSGSQVGRGTLIYPDCHIEGTTKIGKGCTIYPNVRVHNSIIGEEVIIKDSTLVEGAVIKKGATIGPFAHVRPGSVIGPNARIGNFVEVKKSVIGSGTKASHLTYLGDAKIGKEVNIGAGTITCNYDGNKKNVTTIGDGVFIGSNSELIAPINIGKGAYIGAGSTITKDVSTQALALSRVEQKNIEGWAKKRRLKVQSLKLKGKKARKK